MAGSSATTNINANSGGKFYVAVSWSETGTSTVNNTSTISVTGTIGQRQSGESFWSGNVKAGQLTIYWHDNNAGTDQWITNLNVWEIGYDQASRSVTGSVTVTHKSDGTLSGYAKATWVKDPAGVPYYAPNDGTAETGWVALTTIPRGSSGKFSKTTYTIGEEIKINFDRKSTSFTEAGYIQYPDRSGWIWAGEKYFSGAGDSWSWTPTQAEINMLYGQVPNAQSATMWADCKTLSGGTEINQFAVGPATMSVDPSVCSPLFSDFTYADTNATTTAITGNNSVMISGKSTLTATISAANKATPRLSATMDKYTFAVADLFTDESYSESAITKTLGSPTVANTELPSATRDLTVSAIDSRGISTTVTKAITIVPYQAPIVNATAKRVNGFENDTTIKISGSFSRIEVSGTAKNTVNSSTGVKYRYKAQSTSTWGSWTNKTATVDTATGSVTVADFTLSLDNQTAYDIEVRITDKLETTTVALVVSVGQPAFFIGSDGRVSIGAMPSKSISSGETGLLELANGRIYGNIGMKNSNLVVSTDTPASWATALGQGRSMVEYTTSGKFANQPSQHGVLDAMVSGNYVIQEWTDLSNGKTYRRTGSGSTWSYFSGRFSEVEKTSPDAISNNPSIFRFTSKVATGTTVAAVTNKGKNITFQRVGSGVGNVITGASGIDHVRVQFAVGHTKSNGNYGACGLASGSTIWGYWSGAKDGTFGSGSNNGIVVDGEVNGYYYGTMVVTSGDKYIEACSYDAIRMSAVNTWSILGQIQSSGSATAMSFCAEVRSKDANTVPAIYVRGVTYEAIDRLFCDIEVFE